MSAQLNAKWIVQHGLDYLPCCDRITISKVAYFAPDLISLGVLFGVATSSHVVKPFLR